MIGGVKMATVKLTDNEKLLLHRMAMSGGRAVWIDENGENDLLKRYEIDDKRFKTLCRLKVIKREKQPDGRSDIVFNSWGKYYVKKEITEKPPTPASPHHDRGQYKAVCELSKKN